MIEAARLSKRYGSACVLRDVSFCLPTGSFTLLRGVSGSGKSTLLRLLAGLERPDGGSVTLMGSSADHLPPNRRGVSMVFQQTALFSHLGVWGNIAFGIPRGDDWALSRARDIAGELELAPLLDKRAAQLSGGEKKRVAIVRALAAERPVYLFDEALTNLDPSLKERCFAVIRGHTQGKTVLYVTHETDLADYGGLPLLTLEKGETKGA